ncbi:MAG: hypothetical protein ACI8P0_001085 [Planctomycetaceae bacterium]|jgi:hypothetical protein
MLEVNYSLVMNCILAQLPDEVQLPQSWLDCVDKTELLPTMGNNRRRFVRRHYCKKCVLDLGQSLPAIARDRAFHCVYCSDVSRLGLSFLHSAELYPGEECTLWTESKKVLVTVARCRRMNSRCFTIGGTFTE